MRHFTSFALALSLSTHIFATDNISTSPMRVAPESNDVGSSAAGNINEIEPLIKNLDKKPVRVWTSETYATFRDEATTRTIKGYAKYAHLGASYTLPSKHTVGAYVSAIKTHDRYSQFSSGQPIDTRGNNYNYGITPYVNLELHQLLSIFAGISYFEGRTKLSQTMVDPNFGTANARPQDAYGFQRSKRISTSIFTRAFFHIAHMVYTQLQIGHIQTTTNSKAFTMLTNVGQPPARSRERTRVVGNLVTSGKLYYYNHSAPIIPFVELGIDTYTNQVRYFDANDRSFKRNPIGYTYGLGLRINPLLGFDGGVSLRRNVGHTKQTINEATVDLTIKL